MAKFSGVIGFSNGTIESPADSGVWIDDIVEKSYFGDIIRDSLKFREADKINNDLSVSLYISIVADAYASEHIFAMRYIKWQGVLWVISDVEPQHPRLLLRLGGVYRGSTPATP